MNEKPYSDLWERLREATPELEETERSPYFEKLCGVRQASVSRWRTGKAGLNPTHARAISRDTGFCIQYLSDGNGPKRWNLRPADIDEVAGYLDQLPEKGRAEIVDFAKWKARGYKGSGGKT